eukprot:jgi/Tetstr1/424492/TSEL_015020.t1
MPLTLSPCGWLVGGVLAAPEADGETVGGACGGKDGGGRMLLHKLSSSSASMLMRSTISSMIRDIAETIDEAWLSRVQQHARRHTHGNALGQPASTSPASPVPPTIAAAE